MRSNVMLLIVWMSLGNVCWAAAELHLQFHMGLGSRQNMMWGGTVANTGSTPNGPAFIVITPVDEHCKVASPVLYSLPSIAPGAQQNVRIPLSMGGLHHYRMTLQAYDMQGFMIPFIDDNAAVLVSREKEEVAYCKQRIR